MPIGAARPDEFAGVAAAVSAADVSAAKLRCDPFRMRILKLSPTADL